MRVLPILILAAMVSEIAVMVAVGRWLGVLPVVILLLLAVFVGFSIIRTTGLNMSQAFRTGPARPGLSRSKR